MIAMMKLTLLAVLVLASFSTISGELSSQQKAEIRMKQMPNSTTTEINKMNHEKASMPSVATINSPKSCDQIKCAIAIAECAVACADEITAEECIKCLGPLYADCKDCF